MDTILKEDEDFVFLRISESSCDPCLVSFIDFFKSYASNKNHPSYLIFNFENERSEKMFKSQYDLDNLKTVNLYESILSEIDSMGITYFGIVSNNLIKEILAVNQFMNDKTIEAFLIKIKK